MNLHLINLKKPEYELLYLYLKNILLTLIQMQFNGFESS
jgi:hypothetical protein